MILQALSGLYERFSGNHDVPRIGYSVQKIGFFVQLKYDGSLSRIIPSKNREPLQTPAGRGKHMPTVLQLQVPDGGNKRTSGIQPHFLWDNAKYVLGYDSKGDHSRAAECFASFRDLHLAFEDEINDKEFSAVCRFLEHWDLREAEKWKDVLRDNGVFMVGMNDYYVHECDAVVDYLDRIRNGNAAVNWKSRPIANYFENNPSMIAGDDASCGQCLVSGRKTRIARVHPDISGFGQKKVTLVSFNLPSFNSYGKEQSFNAPVGVESASRYTAALNAMTDGGMKESHCVAMGGMKVTFWAEKQDVAEEAFRKILGNLPRNSLDRATNKNVASFLECLRKGREPDWSRLGSLPQRRFYILGLSANESRLIVRFFCSSTVGRLGKCFSRHFRDMELDCDGKYEPPTLGQILQGTVVPGKEQSGSGDSSVIANLSGRLFDSILLGNDYPVGVYSRILWRFRHDELNEEVKDRGSRDYVKVSFIKAFLQRNHHKEYSMSLDENNSEPAYLCGRMFAVFEKTQQDTYGAYGKRKDRDSVNDNSKSNKADNRKSGRKDTGVNASVRKCYYGSASSRPGIVFPRLMRLYQHHLDNLEPGLRIKRDSCMQEIVDKLGQVYPQNLNLVEQGIFSIGYYQQMQAFYRRTEDPAPGGDEQVEQQDLFSTPTE